MSCVLETLTIHELNIRRKHLLKQLEKVDREIELRSKECIIDINAILEETSLTVDTIPETTLLEETSLTVDTIPETTLLEEISLTVDTSSETTLLEETSLTVDTSSEKTIVTNANHVNKIDIYQPNIDILPPKKIIIKKNKPSEIPDINKIRIKINIKKIPSVDK